MYHYQPVLYGKGNLILHEALSSRSGVLYSLNPIPVEVAGENEQEIEENLRAMEVDSTRFKPVNLSKVKKEMERWIDIVDTVPESNNPSYDDEDELEQDYYKEDGEVYDICEFIERRK